MVCSIIGVAGIGAGGAYFYKKKTHPRVDPKPSVINQNPPPPPGGVAINVDEPEPTNEEPADEAVPDVET